MGGIAFAEISIDGCSLKGVGDENLPESLIRWSDKIKTNAGVTDWAQLKRHWNKVLSILAKDFINGQAEVDPKHPPQTCQYCDFSSVCRIRHRQELST